MDFSIENVSDDVINLINILEKRLSIPIRSYSENNTIYNKEEVIKTRVNKIKEESRKQLGYITTQTTSIVSIKSLLTDLLTKPVDLSLTFKIQNDNKSLKINFPPNSIDRIPLTYDFTIDWGDGSNSDDVTTHGDKTHTYYNSGDYDVTISGTDVLRINLFENTQLISINSLGLVNNIYNAFNGCTNLESVNSKGGSNIIYCDNAWKNCTGLTKFDASGLTSVTECKGTWGNCIGLTTFDAIGLKSVTDCLSAWNGCTGLTKFDASGLSNVTNCSFAWNNCDSLKEFYTSGLKSVTNCSFAWNGCKSLTKFDTSGLKSVTDCSNAWNNCIGLTTFDAIGLTSVTNCSVAWANCNSLETFVASGLTSVTDCLSAWANCNSLETFDTSGLTMVTNCRDAWKNCTGLETFNAIGLTMVTNCTGAWINTTDWILGETFTNIGGTLDTSTGWNPVTDISGNPKTLEFQADIRTTTVSFNIPDDDKDVLIEFTKSSTDFKDSPIDCTINWGDESENDSILGERGISHTYTVPGIYHVVISGNSCPRIKINSTKLISINSLGLLTSVNGSFADCTNLESVDSKGGSNITDCIGAWNSCTGLTEFDANGLTSVTDCKNAWGNCTGLTTFDAFGLTSVTDCLGSWYACTGLETFVASGLDSVTDCSYAWGGCESLETFDTSGLTSVTDCSNAWNSCIGLETFDASGLKSVTDCSNAWANTIEWILGDPDENKITFKNSTEINSKNPTGWSPGPTGNPNTGFQADIGTTNLSFNIQDNNGVVINFTDSSTECTINWGDESENDSILGERGISHTYTVPGIYHVVISGNSCPRISIQSTKLISINSLGLLTSVNGSFSGCTNLESVNSKGGSNITDCSDAWNGCKSLTTFDASGLSNVTDCQSAWYFCESLEKFDASDLTSVTDCSNAWVNCESLTTFVASGLTSVNDCTSAWRNCTGLTTFNTSGLTSVTDCNNAWNNCIGLETFDASGLTSVNDCTSAWRNTGPWVLEKVDENEITFTNVDVNLSGSGAWNPGISEMNNPRTVS
jgi:hypothetical protein